MLLAVGGAELGEKARLISVGNDAPAAFDINFRFAGQTCSRARGKFIDPLTAEFYAHCMSAAAGSKIALDRFGFAPGSGSAPTDRRRRLLDLLMKLSAFATWAGRDAEPAVDHALAEIDRARRLQTAEGDLAAAGAVEAVAVPDGSNPAIELALARLPFLGGLTLKAPE